MLNLSAAEIAASRGRSCRRRRRPIVPPSGGCFLTDLSRIFLLSLVSIFRHTPLAPENDDLLHGSTFSLFTIRGVNTEKAAP
jgi:hypothetical protein